jgi:predicted permease
LFGSFSVPIQIPVSFRVEIDARVLVLTLGVALATGLLFGLLPALQIARPRLAMAIREGGADAGPRRSRLRGTLVVAQVAATFVLLVWASLFFRSLRNVETADLGFRTQGLLVASLNLGYAGYGERTGQIFLERLEARLRALPGVRAVSLATRLPLSLMHRTIDAAPEGYVPPHAGEGKPELDANWVAPDYFKTMETALGAGREFTAADRPNTLPVALVNEALARRFFPAGQALGRRLVVGDTPHTIVGVVRDGKQLSLQGEQQPYVYLDLFQEYEPAVTIHLRTAGDAAGLVPELRREVRALDPKVALFDVKPIARQLDFSLLPQRLAGGLLAAMGTLALVLALLGLYAATAYAVARRTREIGIRVALGAGHRQLLALLLRSGAGQCALGISIGLAIALLCSRLAASLLFGVSSTDPTSLAATAALVLGVALAANLIPALAALHVDPTEALRAE